MANNCLQTKLKVSVDNKSLPVLNYLRIPFTGLNTNDRIFIKRNGTVEIITRDSSYNVTDTYTHQDAGVINVQQNDSGFFDIKYAETLTYVEIRGLLQPSTFSTGEIVKMFPNATELVLSNNVGVYGDILDILTDKMCLDGTELTISSNLINGSLESAAEKCYSKGRVTGTLSFNCQFLKFNNLSRSPKSIITFNSTGCVVTDRDTSQVVGTLNNGVWTYS